VGVLVEVDAVEVRAGGEPLVFDVIVDGVKLALHISVSPLREELDQLLVAGFVLTAHVEGVVDEGLPLGVAQPVGGVVERFADVEQVGLVVAGLLRECDVVVHRLRLRAVGESGDRRDVFQLPGDRRVDQPGELDAHHSRGDPVVLVVEVGVDVGVEQRLDRLGVGGWWWSTAAMGMS